MSYEDEYGEHRFEFDAYDDQPDEYDDWDYGQYDDWDHGQYDEY